MREVIEKDVKNINIKKIDCSDFFGFQAQKYSKLNFHLRDALVGIFCEINPKSLV